MAGSSSTPQKINKQELANAENFWGKFVFYSKIAVVGSAVVLGLMALFLV